VAALALLATPWDFHAADAAAARRLGGIADALRPFLVSGLDGRMGTVRAPTFVLYGTADIVTDPSMMSVFVREIPHARTALIRSAPDGLLDTVPVSVRVNSVRNDDPSLVEPEGGDARLV
jgi:pimeloyl-ACP methyl ester carboxylesterase